MLPQTVARVSFLDNNDLRDSLTTRKFTGRGVQLVLESIV